MTDTAVIVENYDSGLDGVTAKVSVEAVFNRYDRPRFEGPSSAALNPIEDCVFRVAVTNAKTTTHNVNPMEPVTLSCKK